MSKEKESTTFNVEERLVPLKVDKDDAGSQKRKREHQLDTREESNMTAGCEERKVAGGAGSRAKDEI